MSDYIFNHYHSDGAPDFSRFDVALLVPSAEEALRRAREATRAIVENEAVPTFENTLLPMQFAAKDFGAVMTMGHTMNSCAATPETEAAMKTLSAMAAARTVEVLTDAGLFARIKHVHDVASDDKAPIMLDDEDRMLLGNVYRNFTNNGALLDDHEKARLKRINERLSVLANSFSDNIANSTRELFVPVTDEAQLDGLPQGVKNAAAKFAQGKKLDVPFALPVNNAFLQPVMEACHDREIRRQMRETRDRIATYAPYDNAPVALEMLELRHERARLFGKDNHAEHMLQERMLNTPEKLRDFLGKLIGPISAAERREMDEITAFAAKEDGLEAMMPWDFIYYAHKLEKHKLDFDTETARPYFEAGATVDAMFRHFENLFDVRFAETHDYPVYAPGMRVFEVREPGNADATALLFVDLFARENKKPGGWHHAYQRHHEKSDGATQIPVSALVMSFMPPVEGVPTLLRHDDVRTLFHEAGHAMHSALSKARREALSGTVVKRDFVELPSMLLQKWVDTPEGLATFARHHETGAAMPAAMAEKLSMSKNMFSGLAKKRQVYFSLLDLAYHTTDPATITSFDTFEAQLRADIGGLAYDRNFTTRYAHAFGGGYDAGYYSYLWSDVMAADAFETFSRNGLYDRATAQRFKEHILETGGTREPETLYTNFAGRMPGIGPYMRSLGLEAPDATAQQPQHARPAPRPKMG